MIFFKLKLVLIDAISPFTFHLFSSFSPFSPTPDALLFHHFRTPPLRTPTHKEIDAKTDQKTAPDAPLFFFLSLTRKD